MISFPGFLRISYCDFAVFFSKSLAKDYKFSYHSLLKKLKQYENKKELLFNKEYGLYYDKQDQFYCASCKSKDIESPLKKFDDRYKCMVKECGKEYNIDENIFVMS